MGAPAPGADGEAPRPGYPGDTREPPGIAAGTCSPGPQGSPGPTIGETPAGAAGRAGSQEDRTNPRGSVKRAGNSRAGPGTAGGATPDAPQQLCLLWGLCGGTQSPTHRQQTLTPQGTLHWAQSTNVPSLLAQGKSKGPSDPDRPRNRTVPYPCSVHRAARGRRPPPDPALPMARQGWRPSSTGCPGLQGPWECPAPSSSQGHSRQRHAGPGPASRRRLWAHLLVCVQMSTLVWGCRMTSREAMASV